MNFNFTRCVSVAFSFVLVCASPDLASAKSERAAADDSARHTNQGVKFARDKQYEKTITEFSKAIEQEPNDPKNYENRALVYRLTGKREQALGDLTRLIELARRTRKPIRARAKLKFSKENWTRRSMI
jgi:Flp pilus assembly protein TadD